MEYIDGRCLCEDRREGMTTTRLYISLERDGDSGIVNVAEALRRVGPIPSLFFPRVFSKRSASRICFIEWLLCIHKSNPLDRIRLNHLIHHFLWNCSDVRKRCIRRRQTEKRELYTSKLRPFGRDPNDPGPRGGPGRGSARRVSSRDT